MELARWRGVCGGRVSRAEAPAEASRGPGQGQKRLMWGQIVAAAAAVWQERAKVGEKAADI